MPAARPPRMRAPIRIPTLEAVAEMLWYHGVYVTLAAYPLVPRDQAGC